MNKIVLAVMALSLVRVEANGQECSAFETDAFQQQIDRIAAQGGGRVVIPAGVHRVGSLELRSNVELHLEKGAVLEGAVGLEHYRVVTLPYSEGTWSAVVMGLNVTNIAITGEGTIHGRGHDWPIPVGWTDNHEGKRARGLFFSECRDVRLKDFTLRDAACWGIVFKCCDGVVARRVKIDSQANCNNDGFDVEAKNVLIEDCDVDTGDDALCVKSNNPDFTVENVVFRNCIARSHCNGIKIGTATHGRIRNVRYENIRLAAPRRDFLDTRPGNEGKWFFRHRHLRGSATGFGIGAIALECVDGGSVEDVTVENVELSGFLVPIFVRSGARTGRACGTPPNTLYRMRNIVVRNVRGRAEDDRASTVTGVGRVRPENVRLENIDIVCVGSGREESEKYMKTPMPDRTKAYPEATMFGRACPAFGLYAEQVDGLVLENVKFTLAEGTEDVRPPVKIADEWPFIAFRQTFRPLTKPEFFARACQVHEKYRGAFDEVWYGGGKPLAKISCAHDELRAFAALRPQLDRAGLRLSFQQGLTLGHNYTYVGEPGQQAAAGIYLPEEAEPFPDDAWMVTQDGTVAKFKCLCPRSPAVLDYEYRYAKAVIEELHPVTYWLDDDLRLAVGKNGCFCPRCLAAFNAQIGGTFTRETLVRRLFEGQPLDSIRLEWAKFVEESLANYGRQARRAANEVMPECRISLQTVSPDYFLNGRDFGPILKAISDDGQVPAGIRPGHGYYTEGRLPSLLQKSLWMARESERCRRLGAACGTVCYEEETYPRRVMHKSPQAIVTECALALASGCDTLSVYWADGEQPERIEDYERFVKAMAEARPYFARLAAVTKRTSLGGAARLLGSHRYEQRDGMLTDLGHFSAGMDDILFRPDVMLARCGIPVAPAESSAANLAWFLSEKSLASMDETEAAKARADGALDLKLEMYPTVATRMKWLDELDRVTNGRFPVRIDLPHALWVLPRVDVKGKTDSVTVLNISIGDVEDLAVRIRNPSGKDVFVDSPHGSCRLEGVVDAARDELVVRLPRLGGWQIATVFLN